MADWPNPTDGMTDEEKVTYYLGQHTPETQALVKEWQTGEDTAHCVTVKLGRSGYDIVIDTQHDGAYAQLYPLDTPYMEVIAYADEEYRAHNAVGYYNTHTRQATLTVYTYQGDEETKVTQVTFRADSIDDLWMKLGDDD